MLFPSLILDSPQFHSMPLYLTFGKLRTFINGKMDIYLCAYYPP